jgi:hypothetical protein
MKSEAALTLVHDRLVAVLLGETPVKLVGKSLDGLHAVCDALCWILDHDHNRSTELNLARLRAYLHAAGSFLTLEKPAAAHEVAGLREAGERFAIVCESDGHAIQCFTCGSLSHNPNDIENSYCGRCHVFHLDAEKKALIELEKWGAENTQTRDSETRDKEIQSCSIPSKP